VKTFFVEHTTVYIWKYLVLNIRADSLCPQAVLLVLRCMVMDIAEYHYNFVLRFPNQNFVNDTTFDQFKFLCKNTFLNYCKVCCWPAPCGTVV